MIAYHVQYIPNGHPRDDPPSEVGEDVRVGVGVRVSPIELKLKCTEVRRFFCVI